MADTKTKTPTNIVFIKLVPSGKNECRTLEAAYEIYNVVTRERTAKSFVFYHAADHAVHEDTFSDYHMAPTEPDGRCLLQLCQDKEIGKYKIQDFCTAFSEDLQKCFPPQTRHMTFVGDHIWQTRSLLYPFMFSYNPWIQLPRRRLVHFVEFRTFMQPFVVLYTQMGVPFELPKWVFRAQQDVLAQVNFFDNIVQASMRRPIRILKRGEMLEDGEIKARSVPVVSCGCPETNCVAGMCPNQEETRHCPTPECGGCP